MHACMHVCMYVMYVMHVSKRFFIQTFFESEEPPGPTPPPPGVSSARGCIRPLAHSAGAEKSECLSVLLILGDRKARAGIWKVKLHFLKRFVKELEVRWSPEEFAFLGA